MNHIITLENSIRKKHQDNWEMFLSVQKTLVEQRFDWIKLFIDYKGKQLIGKGNLQMGKKDYLVILSYSPFNGNRYDQIFITNIQLNYHRDIHLYGDLSLCLYHPIIDQGPIRKIPLIRMIPWISEWIIFYLQWKKYGVWLGKEIKH
ncbi:hypothetical protein Cycma_3317 [Cyclobacterium marinum DSM 745]|uniref:Type II CBASS E2 protein domain-containing protein n=1 Tax=Cyclobacterium marinum (strain ATCC 25205 / DSM 745 / LMG 13164 / NCIMB 1802) TaxID=880070 RepID=G0IV50_CYCMS|nr:hypothetical protein Cycma_3317 [Cyclobacterium marinum DSM 745]